MTTPTINYPLTQLQQDLAVRYLPGGQTDFSSLLKLPWHRLVLRLPAARTQNLVSAWQSLVAAQEMLRMRLGGGDRGQALQILDAHGEAVTVLADLAELSAFEATLDGPAQCVMVPAEADEILVLLTVHPLFADPASLWFCAEKLTGTAAVARQPTHAFLDLADPVNAHRAASVPRQLPDWEPVYLQCETRADETTPSMHQRLDLIDGGVLRGFNDQALAALWLGFLQRWSDQRSIALLVENEGRDFAELDDLIGPFCSSHVVSMKVDPNRRFSDLCDALQRARPVPITSLSPNIRFGFAVHNKIADLAVETFKPVMPPLALELRVVRSSSGDANLFLSFDGSVFESTLAMTLIEQFLVFAAHLQENPRTALCHIPLLTMAQQQNRLVEWQSQTSRVPHLALNAGFHQAAQARPDQVSLVSGERHLTLGAMQSRVGRMRANLADRGIGPGDCVALNLARGLDLYVSMLAVLDRGAAFLPLDPAYPRDHLLRILRLAEPDLIIIDSPGQTTANPVGEMVSGSWPQTTADALVYPGTKPVDGCLPDDEALAYVLFTSGSTGEPKGVMVRHGSVANHMAWMIDQFRFQGRHRLIQKTSANFDASVWEYATAMLGAATAVIPAPGLEKDPKALVELMNREYVDTFQWVPTALRLLLHDLAGSVPRYVRLLFLGGERCPANLAREAMASWQAEVFNLYGPTETTIQVTCGVPKPEAESVPLGPAITNATVCLLDRALQPVPRQMAGEITIGGESLARGYLNRPAATAERFVPDPWSDQPGARLFKTGDRAIEDTAGSLYYLDRGDGLVKFKGFRISLPEIADQLRRAAAVKEATVDVRTINGQPELVGYLVSSGAPADIEQTVRRQIAEQLPVHMQPTRYLVLAELPTTHSGKIDRKALPDPSARSQTEWVPPSDPLEQALVEIWQDVLGLEAVGVTDNFFQLGGDSIRSIQVLARAQEHGMDYELPAIFEYQTIRELVAHHRDQTPGLATDHHTEPFSLFPGEWRHQLPAEVEDAYPLSTLQTALFYLSRTSTVYEVYVTSFKMAAPLDRGHFETAVERVAGRHPWLRTAFNFNDFDEPYQLVYNQPECPIFFTDLSHLGEADQSKWLTDWIEEEKRTPFDWAQVPFWRIHLHRRGDQGFQCTLVEPIFDGWSVATTMTEILTAYLKLLRGETLQPARPPAVTYRDFVALEQAACQDEATARFWVDWLSGSAMAMLPRPEHRPQVTGLNATRRELITLPEDLARVLTSLSEHRGLPLKHVLFAVHARVVGYVSGERDFRTGMIVNGRPEDPESDQVLGIFINTVPVRMRLIGGTWIELAQQAFDAEKKLLPYRRLPYAVIQQKMNVKPLFDTAFNFTRFHVFNELAAFPELRIEDYVPWDQTFFPFTAQFHVNAFNGQIQLGLDYDSGELDAALMKRMVTYYQRALSGMAFESDSPFLATDLRGETEREAVGRWNQTDRHWPVPNTVPARLRFQLEAVPDRVALLAGGVHLTHAALDRVTARTAAELVRRGVKPGQAVAVVLDRGPHLLVAMLAIWRAGAFYVPLDPDFPVQRINRILDDVSPALTIAHGDDYAVPGERLWTLQPLEQLPATSLPTADPCSIWPAYCIYTSGSTGQPKGVGVSHGALGNFIAAMATQPGLAEDDVLTAVTTLSFDIAGLEWFLPLVTGSRLVVADASTARSAAALHDLLNRHGSTVMQATPATWDMLIAHGMQLPALQQAWCGGDSLPAALAETLTATGRAVWNLYGPTETTIWSTRAHLNLEEGQPSIGQPIENTQIAIVDHYGREVPLETPGELWIGGDGLAFGYHGQPRLTAERFLPSGYGHQPGARWYRTGDLARRLPDGRLMHLGRLDFQVKIRGHRIELGELEHQLLQHSAVQGAVAAKFLADSGQPQLAAYVLSDPADFDESALHTYLNQHLPVYMVPASIVRLDAFPLTANGKIDRGRLPAPQSVYQKRQRAMELLAMIETMDQETVRQNIGMVKS